MYQQQDTEEATSSSNALPTPRRPARKLYELNHPNKDLITPDRHVLALELHEARKKYFAAAKKTAEEAVDEVANADKEALAALQLITSAITAKKPIPVDITDMALKAVKKREAALKKMEATKTLDVEVKNIIEQMLLDSK